MNTEYWYELNPIPDGYVDYIINWILFGNFIILKKVYLTKSTKQQIDGMASPA